MKRINDKRVRLIDGAAQLFLEQGINTTTLANIAELAKVPLGNVYYYFKSKESIIVAVVEHRIKLLQQLFEQINTEVNLDPKQKLEALLKNLLLDNPELIKVGDPIGSLCFELSKETTELNRSAITLMETLVNWCEQQFIALGKAVEAKKLARYWIAKIQGISLLTSTLKEPSYLQEATELLIKWLKSI